MTEQTTSRPTPSARRNPRFRIGALIVLAVVVGLILWLALRNGDSSPSSATAVSVAQIQTLATSVGHPVFWVGPKQGYTYELMRTPDGSITIRYLPPGVKVGAKEQYLTVATYPFGGAFAAIQRVLTSPDSVPIRLANNGLAEFSKGKPHNVHAAYPGVDYQIEIFDPAPGKAAAIVRAGRLAAFGSLGGTTTGSTAPAAKSTAASLADLKSLAGSIGHPIYWAGPRRGYTYELTRESNGNVEIRYLPPGVKVGATKQYLTVATYPFPKAFQAIQRVAKGKNIVKIKLANGGLATFDPNDPTNIHLAYPGSDYQVEVFDPSGRTRRIVASGRIASIG